MPKLLSRDDFRNGVFARDNYTCVSCGYVCKDQSKPQKELDAHHILERRLFDDGGYYLENGATLCKEMCHMWAEQTSIQPHILRERCGIKEIVLPEHLYADLTYDKWGNILNHNGRNIPGELFWDESVVKVMGEARRKAFCKHIKYPRTYHLPFSQPDRESDRYLSDTKNFEGRRVIITEKRDGENTTMYDDHIHARSLDSRSHPSRDWIKQFHSMKAYIIPPQMRVCGESLYAKHTVGYEDLTTFFEVFSIWDNDRCLSWDDTLEWAELLELETVPVLYDGNFDDVDFKSFIREGNFDGVQREGFVVRIADEFRMRDFKTHVAKFVGEGFVLPHGHWTSSWSKNSLKANP